MSDPDVVRFNRSTYSDEEPVTTEDHIGPEIMHVYQVGQAEIMHVFTRSVTLRLSIFTRSVTVIAGTFTRLVTVMLRNPTLMNIPQC